MGRNAAGKHGFCLFPILFDKDSKIDMSKKAGDQSGREKTMKEAVIKDEVPTEAKEGERKKISQRFPDNRSSQG
jgi:hypothetical protein